MAYFITKTNGSTLVELSDTLVDQSATDLTLIGREAVSYGTFLNDNLVRLLENFANDYPPGRPMKGQLWYDSNENRLKVYDGVTFKSSSGVILGSSAPSDSVQGDLWIDTTNDQMYFNNGNQNILLGPLYSATKQGISGFLLETILDTANNEHHILKLFLATKLIGVFSNSAFIPKTPIDGFTDLQVGFNVVDIENFKYLGVASRSEYLLGQYGSLLNYLDLVTVDGDSTIQGTLTVNDVILMNTPIDDNHVATVQTVKQKPLAISLNLTGLNDTDIAALLEKIYPYSEVGVVGIDGPICRVVGHANEIKEFKIINGVWTFVQTL